MPRLARTPFAGQTPAMMTQKAMATARRNLAQRIARFGDMYESNLNVSPWQCDQVLRAIAHLRVGDYPEGEWTMLRAERPDLYEPPGYVPAEDADAAKLRDHLKLVMQAG